MNSYTGEPFVIRQVILDDNGLKDESAAKILEGINLYESIEYIGYSNNEMGPKTVSIIK